MTATATIYEPTDLALKAYGFGGSGSYTETKADDDTGWRTIDGRHVYFGDDGEQHTGKDAVEASKKDSEKSSDEADSKSQHAHESTANSNASSDTKINSYSANSNSSKAKENNSADASDSKLKEAQAHHEKAARAHARAAKHLESNPSGTQPNTGGTKEDESKKDTNAKLHRDAQRAHESAADKLSEHLHHSSRDSLEEAKKDAASSTEKADTATKNARKFDKEKSTANNSAGRESHKAKSESDGIGFHTTEGDIQHAHHNIAAHHTSAAEAHREQASRARNGNDQAAHHAAAKAHLEAAAKHKALSLRGPYEKKSEADDIMSAKAARSEFMKTAADVLISYGSELKATGTDENGDFHFGGYLVLFDSHDVSRQRDKYLKSTDYDFEDGDKTTIYFHHGLDETLKATKLGTGKLYMKDAGVWMDGIIKARTDYLAKHVDKIKDGIKDGYFGLSSGVPAHLVERKAVPAGHEVLTWPLGKDASITHIPAEPKTMCFSLKSLMEEESGEALPEDGPFSGADTPLEAKYSDDEERDEHGRWTAGGAKDALSASEAADSASQDTGVDSSPDDEVGGGTYFAKDFALSATEGGKEAANNHGTAANLHQIMVDYHNDQAKQSSDVDEKLAHQKAATLHTTAAAMHRGLAKAASGSSSPSSGESGSATSNSQSAISGAAMDESQAAWKATNKAEGPGPKSHSRMHRVGETSAIARRATQTEDPRQAIALHNQAAKDHETHAAIHSNRANYPDDPTAGSNRTMEQASRDHLAASDAHEKAAKAHRNAARMLKKYLPEKKDDGSYDDVSSIITPDVIQVLADGRHVGLRFQDHPKVVLAAMKGFVHRLFDWHVDRTASRKSGQVYSGDNWDMHDTICNGMAQMVQQYRNHLDDNCPPGRKPCKVPVVQLGTAAPLSWSDSGGALGTDQFKATDSADALERMEAELLERQAAFARLRADGLLIQERMVAAAVD